MATSKVDNGLLCSIGMNSRVNSNTNRFYLRFRRVLAVSVLMLMLLVGCTSHSNYISRADLDTYSESGTASYYAAKYQGRETASGERLNNYSMTAAHKSLPFGTRVIVTNVNNGKTVTVTINDRGPFVKGRIIDLTEAAFTRIENIDRGVAEVEIRVVN